jgi:signal transduction histidine kinase
MPSSSARTVPLPWLYGIAALLILVLLAVSGIAIVHLRKATLQEKEGNLKNLSLMLAEQADRSLQSVDLVLSSTVDGLLSDGATDAASFIEKASGHDFHLLLREKMTGTPQLDAVVVEDATGKVINFSRSWPVPQIDNSDRDYFRALRDDPRKGVYVSQPVRNRGSGTWSIMLARRVNGPGGEFLGVILGAIELRYFEDFYRAIAPVGDTSFALQRFDGVMLARYPVTDAIGKTFSSAEHLLQGGSAGFVRETSPIDGMMRLKATHRLTNYSVVALATTSEDTALTDWRGITLLISLGTLGTALSIGIAAFAVGRHWVQHAALAEQRLEVRLRESIEALTEGFALYDADERLVLCNSKYRELYAWEAELIVPGVRYEELVRFTAERTVYAEAVGNTEAWVAGRLAELRNPSGPLQQHLSDGRWFRHANYRTASGGTICLRTDITAQMLTEHGLREAKEAAEAANVAKSQFLANMSHELRTPLNAIIGFSEALELGMAGPLQPKQAEYIADVQNSGRHLLNVINDILDLAKVDAGKFELREEDDVDPCHVVETCIALLQPRADAGAVQLSVELRDHPPPLLVADPTRLKQILLNLLSNAVKFTDHGGFVAVVVRRSSHGDVIFEVHDTGLGMTTDEIEIALQPFGQVEADHTRRYEGTGLGLPLARRLTELHGGSLHIESKKGGGTTVTVTLPAIRTLARPPVKAGATGTAA